MNIRLACPVIVVSFAASVSAFGWGDDAPPPDLLRGPEVTSVSHASNLGMLANGNQRRALQRDAVPVRRWFSEYAQLELTKEQRAQFTQLKDAFNARATAFKSEHGDRVKAVRNALRALEQTDQPAPVERVRALQDEQARLDRDAPKVQTLQIACWGLLTMPQQDAFRVQLAEIRAQIRRQRVIERMREEASMSEGAMQDSPMSDASTPTPDAGPMQGASPDGYD